MKYQKYSLDRTVRLAIRIVIIISIFFLIRYLYNVLLPFVIGWFIAYFIYPLVKFIQHRIKVHNRTAAIALAMLAVGGVLTGIGFLTIPVIYNEIAKVIPVVVKYIQNLGDYPFVNEILLNNLQTYFEDFNYERLISIESLNAIMSKILPKLWGLMSNIWQMVLAIISIFFIILYIIFILHDYEELNKGFIKLFPVKYRKFAGELKSELSGAMNRYFRGQALICLITAILYSIGFYIIGMPLAIVLGLLIGLLTIVPYLHSLGFIPVITVAIINSIETGSSLGLTLLGVLIVFLIIQAFTDVFLVPKIMGRNMGLNPAIILLSLSIFSLLFGFLGLIIALPVTTIAISYYKRFVTGNEQIIEDA